MGSRVLSRGLNKVPLRFRDLNSPCMRISTPMDVYFPPENDYRLLIAKLDNICFC